ncbi:GNAT family N-acetyltransferase [Yoonia sp.]|jgi:GNAT superfamily N-acetyltransferase|uniref:GNAT family N-acetyltransferase n=1 Tax=Yoonia sp. TaxID=2212373 RepID=UPI00239AC7B1|nr:GNAT family N-acetyltransferase [Yoonia sp.]MDE0852566.1 GNAT family N-acetyltransferase [Yoonia sp.]
MSAAVNLANESNADLCLALMEKYHTEQNLPYDDAHRLAVAAPLLAGNPLGAIWLIGPSRAPLGYVLVTFAWSVDAGGMVGWISEIYMRPSVRKRGIGTETLHAIGVALKAGGVKALHAELSATDSPLTHFWNRVGFQTDRSLAIVTDILS